MYRSIDSNRKTRKKSRWKERRTNTLTKLTRQNYVPHRVKMESDSQIIGSFSDTEELASR